jgi:hypothetical protein
VIGCGNRTLPQALARFVPLHLPLSRLAELLKDSLPAPMVAPRQLGFQHDGTLHDYYGPGRSAVKMTLDLDAWKARLQQEQRAG